MIRSYIVWIPGLALLCFDLAGHGIFVRPTGVALKICLVLAVQAARCTMIIFGLRVRSFLFAEHNPPDATLFAPCAAIIAPELWGVNK